MIKKMMALLAAISCAIGAWADVSEHLSGTDFSTHPVGTFETQHDDAGNPIDVDHHTYWFTGDPDFEGTIVTNALEEKFLDFESNITNPLYRTISICDDPGSPTNFVTTPIGSGLFIDTHVQFTPYLVNENHPAPEAVTTDDKLIVWVRETEVDGGPNVTNLIVTAGYFDDGGNVSASNYVATLSSAYVSDLCSDACRLTIKSYENVTRQSGAYVMGFVVYIDEVAIGYEGDAFDDDCVLITAGLKTNPAQYYTQGGATNKLFLSLLPAASSSANSKLSGVGYAGMGKIGDVYFDDYDHIVPDFAKDARAFTVEMGDGVESFMYNNVPYNTSTNLTAPSTVASVTISNVTYLSGWKHKDDTWRNGNDQVVSNRVGAAGDYGTFYFADGDVFTLVGFQPNYQVVVGGVTNEYQTLYGTGGALAAALSAGNLILNRDIVISEGSGDFAGCLLLEEGTLTIDLNGHTIKGTGVATIINLAGTLTINDSSAGQTGKVLDSGDVCLYVAGGTTTLNAGTFEHIVSEANVTIVINGGTYLDDGHTPDADDFYLQAYVASGDVTWDQVGGHWYATVGGSVATTWDITFSTNNVVVSEWNLTVDAGDPIGNHIPNFTGGSWDAPAPTAETIVTSDTNFNYTIAVQLSYFPQIPIEEQWADRDGTAAKPFVIRNAADFGGLKTDVAAGYNADKYFEVVVDDITLTDWTGIGSSSKPFSGTLIGGGKTVNITFSSAKDNGLFAYVSNATLSNLTVNASSGTIGSETGGAAFVGIAAGSCTFTALKATGSLGTSANPTTRNTAGICERITTGDSSWTINFNYCTNAMTIYGNYTKVGGILAFRDGGTAVVNFNNCVNSGNVSNAYPTSGQYGTGGLMGWTGGVSAPININGCVNTGMITAADGTAGNFLGFVNFQPTASGTNVGLASLKASGSSYISNLDWASVSGDIATFVTPTTTVVGNATYKLMQSEVSSASLGFTLADADASLTILTNFHAYTGSVVLDSSLTAQGYELVTTPVANGVTFTAGSSDPWAPAAETDEAAAAKAAELFGAESEVAANVDTLAEYNALVAYIKSVTSQSEVPTDLTTNEKTYMWKSFILGADPLFDAEPAVQITSLTASSEAGKWDFTVKVTEGESTDAYNVAADKVGALVKISSSLTPGTWVAPTAGNISAVKLLGGNLIQVEVNFGDGTSGFMKVSEE